LDFTLAESDDSLKINLVSEVENDFKPSFIVFRLFAIFLQGDNDLGLRSAGILQLEFPAYLGRFGTGKLDGSVQVFPVHHQ
jgi:hypothetical protein